MKSREVSTKKRGLNEQQKLAPFVFIRSSKPLKRQEKLCQRKSDCKRKISIKSLKPAKNFD
jgi:hypothetical protein